MNPAINILIDTGFKGSWRQSLAFFWAILFFLPFIRPYMNPKHPSYQTEKLMITFLTQELQMGQDTWSKEEVYYP